MKRVFFLLLAIVCFSIPSAFAHEMYDDGWHVVVKNAADQAGKSWAEQDKEWAYYENGKEIMRYSKLIGSHRGWGTAPENSLASFQETLSQGYYVFETDVRFTKDNVAVLSHDDKINNVARNNDLSVISGDVYVKDLTYQQLKSNYVFNIERVNHTSPTELSGYENNRITSFEEMIDFVVANKMHVSIELKDGTQEQIESIVKMTQDKGAHNYVRWISFYTDLLKYVVDYDDDEMIGVNKNTTCDTVHNLFCGEEVDYFVNKLKTDKNLLWLAGYSGVKLPSLSCAVNMPKDQSGNEQPPHKGTAIPQGKVTLEETDISVDYGSTKSVSYQYSGDGAVTCVSTNPNSLYCQVDEANHKIVLTPENNSSASVSVKVYATQGISTSASGDATLRVVVVGEKEIARRNIKSITVKNYPFDFKPEKTLYQLAISQDDSLDIQVDFLTDGYTYLIEGNENLKTGSDIQIHIIKDEQLLLTYHIGITKEEKVPIPDTFRSVSKLFLIVANLILLSGFGIILLQKKLAK